MSAQAAPSATAGAARRACRSTDSGATIQRGWRLEAAASWLKQLAAAGLVVVLAGCPILANEDALPASTPAVQSGPSKDGLAIEWEGTISLGGGTYGVGVGIVSDGGFVVLAQGETSEDRGDVVVQAPPSSAIDNLPPEITILSPRDGSVFEEGNAIYFEGSAVDPEDGPLPEAALVWGAVSLSQQRERGLGFGSSLTRDDLPPGTHYVIFGAVDSGGMSAQKIITILVTSSPTTANRPPVANAGKDSAAATGTQVAMDGVGSYDPDGDSLTYSWYQTEGPRVVLSDSHSSTASFMADRADTYVFALVVSDGTEASVPDAVVVTVTEPDREVMSAVGNYINPLNGDDSLEIDADGSCYMEILGLNVGTTGRWQVEDSQIMLLFPSGSSFRGQVKVNAILLEGFGMLPVVWVKPTRAAPTVREVAGAYTKEGASGDHLVLSADETYTKTETGVANEPWTDAGSWKLDGHVLVLHSGAWDLAVSAAVLESGLYFSGLLGPEVWTTEGASNSLPAEPTFEPEVRGIPAGEPPAVEWQRTIDLGGANGLEVRPLSGGGFVVLAQGVAQDQSWLVRVDAAGKILWQKSLSDRPTVAYSLDVVEDGSVFVVGTTQGDDATSAWMIKLDPMGERIWERTYVGHSRNKYGEEVESDRCAYAGRGTPDGGYIVVGEAGDRVLLLKLDPSGNAEWERIFGDGSWRDWGLSCAQAADGGYVIAALSFSHNPGEWQEDIWLIRTDSQGQMLWDRLFGGDETEGPPHITKTADGGYVVVALTDRDPRVADHDLWVFKTSGDGGEIWSLRFDRAHEIEMTWVSEASDGGYLVCASYVGERNSSWLWLMKLSSAGDAEWSKIAELESIGACVQPTPDGGCVAVGTAVGGSDGDDILLIKLAPYQVKDGEVPVADAGPDQRLVDSDGDGRETVALDGSASFDEVGQIVAYVWSEEGKEFARGQRVSADFVVGEHTIELTVTDSDGLTATTETIVAIIQPQDPLAMHLRGHGSVDPVLEVDVGQLFDIELETDGVEPAQVRFLIDSQKDDHPYGEWTSWYEWGDSAEGWDASSKRLAWSCASSGQKEIWAEALYADAHLVRASACVLVASVGEPPACAGPPPAVLWDVAYDGGFPADLVWDAVSMTDGGFSLLCYSGESWPLWVVRTDKAGAVVWDKHFPEWALAALSIEETDEGGVLIVGSQRTEGSGTRCLSILKLSTDGETVWERMYCAEGGTGFAGIGVENCADGGYFVTAGRPAGILVLRIDSAGNVEWQRQHDLWPEGTRLTLCSCAPMLDGGFMLGGIAEPGDESPPSMWALKLDPTGSVEAQYSLSADARNRRGWIEVLPSGEALLARGVIAQEGGERFGLQITRLDRTGGDVWERTYIEEQPMSEAGAVRYVFTTICATRGGGFLAALTSAFSRAEDTPEDAAWTTRSCAVRALDAAGQCLWETRYSDRVINRLLAPESGGYALVGLANDPCIARIADDRHAPPVADAGPDQTIIDSGGDGEETLTLDGRGSSASDGRIASYVWTEAGQELGRGETARATLRLGVHTITLVVLDDRALSSSDTTTIEVCAPVAPCSVELRQDLAAAPIDTVRVEAPFAIYVGQNRPLIDRVRFSSDDVIDGVPEGEWTQWQDWVSSAGDWNAADKTMKWTFASTGDKEVWVEVASAGAANRCAATISVTPAVSFWAEVANAPQGRWTIRRSPGASNENEVLKRVPNGWVMRVTDTHVNGEIKDGYIWWEVEDTTEGLTGWMAAAKEEGEGGTKYLVGDIQDPSSQEKLGRKADPSFADTKEERTQTLRTAVEHYFADATTQSSLYSSDDRARDGTPNDLSLLRREGFPIEVVLAVIVQESGGAKEPYDNSGLGSMQITDRNLKGLSSGIQCDDEEAAKFYGNTPQSIYANVKDGLKTLRDNFHRRRHMQSRLGFAVLEYNIGGDPNTGFCYMCWGDPFYLAHIGMRLDGDDQCEGGACAKLRFRRPACDPPSLACGVSTKPTVKELGAELQPRLAEQLKSYQTNYVMAFTCSPAAVRIRDSAGRVTGLLGGRVVEDVPDCAYIGGAAISLSPENSFVYEVVGQSEGAYDLVVDHVVAGGQETVEAAGVPTSPGAIHRYLVDWGALAAGESGVTLMVDEDGDGEYERSLEAGARLDGADLQMRSPSQVTEHGSGTWLYAAIGLALGGGLAALGILALRGRRSRR